jgi:hypothetical protein
LPSIERIALTGLNLVPFAAIAFAAIAAVARPAAAIEYRWCAQYGGGAKRDGKNCGFVSYKQCMETIHGMGGFCQPNLFYSDASKRKHQY